MHYRELHNSLLPVLGEFLHTCMGKGFYHALHCRKHPPHFLEQFLRALLLERCQFQVCLVHTSHPTLQLILRVVILLEYTQATQVSDHTNLGLT